jgi:DNA-binding IclR family transcriptional regulator
MPADSGSDAKGQIPTNLRLLLILEEVAKAGAPVAPSALSDALGLPKPTIHRLLTTAEEEGFLQRDIDGRSYGPGRRMRRLAGNTLSTKRMRTERMMIMRALADTVGETCNLAAPGRHGMVYLDRVETHWPLRIQLPVGTQVPFHCTASGKLYLSSLSKAQLSKYLGIAQLERRTPHTITEPDALLAETRAVRKQGYALDREEFMEDMIALAVPVLAVNGRLMTTLSFHAPKQRFDVDKALGYLEPLRQAAQELSRLVLDGEET